MIAEDCPAPSQGPIPCPTTTDQVLDKLRRILPRGIAWVSVFDPRSVMYGYWRGVSATYCWFTNECCLMLNEMFCATRNWLTPDYLVEFGLPDACTCNINPCLLYPDTRHCQDLVEFAYQIGWNLTCRDRPRYVAASNCAVCGCASASDNEPPGTLDLVVNTKLSPIFNPQPSPMSGLAVSGISISGCEQESCGTIESLHCMIDSFLPAHVSYGLTVTP
jgi:hypothetical protein